MARSASVRSWESAAANALSLGVVSPDRARGIIEAGFALAERAAADGKIRDFCSILRTLKGLVGLQLDGPPYQQSLHQHVHVHQDDDLTPRNGVSNADRARIEAALRRIGAHVTLPRAINDGSAVSSPIETPTKPTQTKAKPARKRKPRAKKAQNK